MKQLNNYIQERLTTNKDKITEKFPNYSFPYKDELIDLLNRTKFKSSYSKNQDILLVAQDITVNFLEYKELFSNMMVNSKKFNKHDCWINQVDNNRYQARDLTYKSDKGYYKICSIIKDKFNNQILISFYTSKKKQHEFKVPSVFKNIVKDPTQWYISSDVVLFIEEYANNVKEEYNG